MVLNGDLRLSFNSLTSLLKANSADPGQMPRSAASDQGLHCLPHTQQFETYQQTLFGI